MHQFSVRLSDERGNAVRRLAAARGRSVNQTFEDIGRGSYGPRELPRPRGGDPARAPRPRVGAAAFELSALPEALPPSSGGTELARARAEARGERHPGLERLVGAKAGAERPVEISSALVKALRRREGRRRGASRGARGRAWRRARWRAGAEVLAAVRPVARRTRRPRMPQMLDRAFLGDVRNGRFAVVPMVEAVVTTRSTAFGGTVFARGDANQLRERARSPRRRTRTWITMAVDSSGSYERRRASRGHFRLLPG